jgi:hypothetical protein
MQIAISSLLVISIIGWISPSVSSIASTAKAIGVGLGKTLSVSLVSIIVLVATLVAIANGANAWQLLKDYSPLVGVVLLAWAGLFVSEVLIRRIAYHEVSLQRSYGIYKAVNWVSVSGFLAAVCLGFGLVTSSGLPWLGFLVRFMPIGSIWHEAQLGFALSFFIAALIPVLFGIGRIKRQEAEVLAIENRKNDLANVSF